MKILRNLFVLKKYLVEDQEDNVIVFFLNRTIMFYP